MALVVFTGGARSGKSSAAAALARTRAAEGREVTVAVFGRDDGSDPEFADRVAKHRADRPAGWKTVEAHGATGWLDQVAADDVLLVDCVGTMLGLAMEDAIAVCGDCALQHAAAESLPEGYEEAVVARFEPAVEELVRRVGDTIVVTNEVGSGVVPGYASARLFRDVLGRANGRLVSAADAAWFVTCGRLIDLSSAPGAAKWPED
jgi:adenosyl cobinamide kinase/adenosyl cobinamide phosphate guanylyltransferase